MIVRLGHLKTDIQNYPHLNHELISLIYIHADQALSPKLKITTLYQRDSEWLIIHILFSDAAYNVRTLISSGFREFCDFYDFRDNTKLHLTDFFSIFGKLELG